MARGVIFDMDGTLIDSVDLHAQAWVDAFAETGRSFDFARVREQIGKGSDQLLPVFLSSEDIIAQGEDLDRRQSEIFKERYLSKVRPFADVRRLVERLLEDGRRVAIASSAKADDLDAYKRIANIADLIRTETTSDDADKSKPHPDIFDAALEALGPTVRREEVVVVGDTAYDAEAAAKAGLKAVGVLCGGWSEDRLRASGCFAVYKDPADLLRHYGSALI